MSSRVTPKAELVERLAKVSEMDWARMAAFIDGEGCITIYVSNSPKYNQRARSPKYTLTVTVANTDPRLIQWIVQRFGGYVHIRKQQKAKWRVAYAWAASAHLGMLILRGCMPFFVLKKEQADIALAIAETMRASTSVVPVEVTTHREELRQKLVALKKQHYPEDAKFLQ